MLKEESDFLSTRDQFHVRHVMRRDGVSIQHAEAIKLTRLVNTSTALFGRDTSFVEMVKELVDYAGTFELEYGVNVVDASMSDVVEDMHSSDYLPTIIHWTHNWYTRFANLAIQNKQILDLLEALTLRVHVESRWVSLTWTVR